jgi:hypothetical protein
VIRLQELVGGAGDLGWVVVKAVLMFAVAVIGLRLGERRTLAQLGAFDFAVAVAIGAIIGRTVTASSASFVTGAVALVTLLVVHRLVAFARRHSRIARVIDHPPRILVARGQIQDRELARAGLTAADVYALLRQQGVDDLSRVGYLLYETRGVTTLIGADGEPGPLLRDGLSAAGYRDVAERVERSVRRRQRALRHDGTMTPLGGHGGDYELRLQGTMPHKDDQDHGGWPLASPSRVPLSPSAP